MRAAARARLHLEKGHPSVEGLLMKQRGKSVIAGHYVLRDAKLLVSAEESVKVDGELHVPAGRVVYVEVIG